MPFVTEYAVSPQLTGQVAYQGGLGDFRFRERQFEEQQRQFDSTQAYRYDTLNEQARQFDTSHGEQIRQFDATQQLRYDTLNEDVRQFESNFGEQVRQFDATLDERTRQFDVNFQEQQRQFNAQQVQQQQLAVLDSQTRLQGQFVSEAGAAYRQQQQIIAGERQALFSAYANQQQQRYAAEIQSRQAYQQAALEAGLINHRAGVQVDQFNQMANQQRQQQLAQLQQQAQIIQQSPNLSQSERSYALGQLTQRAAGLENADPLQFMSPMQREQYIRSQADIAKFQLQQDVKSATGLTVPQLLESGYIPIRDPETGRLSIERNYVKEADRLAQSQLAERQMMEQSNFRQKMAELQADKQKEILKALPSLVTSEKGEDGKTTYSYDPALLPLFMQVAPEAFPIDKATGRRIPPQLTPKKSASINMDPFGDTQADIDARQKRQQAAPARKPLSQDQQYRSSGRRAQYLPGA